MKSIMFPVCSSHWHGQRSICKTWAEISPLSWRWNMENLVTVVDESNRPLCYLAKSAASQQNLVWRSVALLIAAPEEKYVFCWESPLAIGFPLFSELPAFVGGEEFCLRQLKSLPGLADFPLKKIALYKPCPQNDHTFTTLYKGRSARFRDNPHSRFFLADMDDIAGLRQAGCAVHPFLEIIMEALPRPVLPAGWAARLSEKFLGQ